MSRDMLHPEAQLIDHMLTVLIRFKQQCYGASLVKFSGQAEIQFFNEAALLAACELNALDQF